MSEEQVFITKHIVIEYTVDRQRLVAPTEYTIFVFEPDKMAAQHCKPLVRRNTQMSSLKTV